MISNPNAEHVVIWSLLVEPHARGNRLCVDMLKSIIAYHPGKTWHIPTLFPEEFGKVFERSGFEREDLSQWQMRLALERCSWRLSRENLFITQSVIGWVRSDVLSRVDTCTSRKCR